MMKMKYSFYETLSLSFEDTREWLCLFFFLDSYLSKKKFNTRTFMGPLSFLFFHVDLHGSPFYKPMPLLMHICDTLDV